MSTAGTVYDQEIRLGHAKLVSNQVVVSPVGGVYFTSAVLDPAFDTFLFRLIDLMPSVSAGRLFMSGAANGSGIADGTIFQQAFQFTTSHSSSGGSGAPSSTVFQVTSSCVLGPMGGAEVYWNRGNFDKQFTFHSTCNSPEGYGQASYFGSAKAQSNVASVWFGFGNGNIASGIFRCYGFRKGA